MPITFNSAGGFLAGTISSSGNDIFIITSGSVGSVNVGNVEYTGSQVIEKDSTGKIRNKKTFNTDGTITQEKFDQNEKITETKVKNPSSGKEFIRSGSATSNQIEMLQNANGAFITVSGSLPGYNIIQTPQGGSSRIRQLKFNRDFFYDGGSSVFTVGVDSASKAFFVNSNIGGSATATSLIRASASGDFFVQGKIFAQEFHTKLISSSIVFQSGSTIFGDTHDDTHTFTGKFINAITASGDISASGALKGGSLDINGTSNISDTATFTGQILSYRTAFPQLQLSDDSGTDIMSLGHSGNIFYFKTSDTSNDIRFRRQDNFDVIEIDMSAEMTHISGGLNVRGPNGHITASGNISASGDVFAHSGSFTYITASIVDVDGDTIRFGGEPFTKANIQTLKLGRSLKPPRAGRSKPDVDGDDGVFDGNITASGNIKAGGNLELTASSAGDVLKTKFVQMTNSSSVIDTFNTGSFRSVKYVLQVTSASNFQVSEMLVLHHNSTASNTEYAQINSGLNLINFSTDVNNSNIRLNANGSFISCSVRYDRTIIPI